jgi:hypothetical protein
VGVTIWWLCACRQRDTGATAKRKANYTLPFGRLFLFTGQEHGIGSTAVELTLPCDAGKKGRRWQVSRARPQLAQQTLGGTNSGSHRGETRMVPVVQHSDDGGACCRSAEADSSAVTIVCDTTDDGDRLCTLGGAVPCIVQRHNISFHLDGLIVQTRAFPFTKEDHLSRLHTVVGDGSQTPPDTTGLSKSMLHD